MILHTGVVRLLEMNSGDPDIDPEPENIFYRENDDTKQVYGKEIGFIFSIKSVFCFENNHNNVEQDNGCNKINNKFSGLVIIRRGFEQDIDLFLDSAVQTRLNTRCTFFHGY